MSAPPADVIDWQEALQQTGDDEEFLRELLADLRQETDTQVANIEQIIQVRIPDRFRMASCYWYYVHRILTSIFGTDFPIFYFIVVLWLIQNPTDSPFQRIQRAAHVIKGASANLMCAQLRFTSMALEQSAQAAHAENSGQPSAETTQRVQACYLDLKKAQQNYHAFLQNLGIWVTLAPFSWDRQKAQRCRF